MMGSKSTQNGRKSDTLHQQLLLNQLHPLKNWKREESDCSICKRTKTKIIRQNTIEGEVVKTSMEI